MKKLILNTQSCPAIIVPMTLADALDDFIRCFELVFGVTDWATTLDNLRSEYLIHPGGTFLAPGVCDESANWHNRGSLLTAYRVLLVAMSGVECSAVNVVTTISLVKAGDLLTPKHNSERNSCHATD